MHNEHNRIYRVYVLLPPMYIDCFMCCVVFFLALLLLLLVAVVVFIHPIRIAILPRIKWQLACRPTEQANEPNGSHLHFDSERIFVLENWSFGVSRSFAVAMQEWKSFSPFTINFLAVATNAPFFNIA